MKKTVIAALLLAATAASAQTGRYQGQLSANPYAQNKVQPGTPLSGSSLYDQNGTYRGKVGNQYEADSINNPYGRYGSKYSADSVKNPYSQAGSQYSPLSPSNPFGQGVSAYDGK